MFHCCLDKKLHKYNFYAFSKNILNFDFFSKFSEFIIKISSISSSFNSSIIFNILSEALLIIINFSSSNSDLVNMILNSQ